MAGSPPWSYPAYDPPTTAYCVQLHHALGIAIAALGDDSTDLGRRSATVPTGPNPRSSTARRRWSDRSSCPGQEDLRPRIDTWAVSITDVLDSDAANRRRSSSRRCVTVRELPTRRLRRGSASACGDIAWLFASTSRAVHGHGGPERRCPRITFRGCGKCLRERLARQSAPSLSGGGALLCVGDVSPLNLSGSATRGHSGLVLVSA